jgi:hypothetical protein
VESIVQFVSYQVMWWWSSSVLLGLAASIWVAHHPFGNSEECDALIVLQASAIRWDFESSMMHGVHADEYTHS